MLAGQFAPQFPIALVEKDFAYVGQAAGDNPAAIPMAEAARKVFRQALAQGLGGDNITGVVKLFA